MPTKKSKLPPGQKEYNHLQMEIQEELETSVSSINSATEEGRQLRFESIRKVAKKVNDYNKTAKIHFSRETFRECVKKAFKKYNENPELELFKPELESIYNSVERPNDYQKVLQELLKDRQKIKAAVEKRLNVSKKAASVWDLMDSRHVLQVFIKDNRFLDAYSKILEEDLDLSGIAKQIAVERAQKEEAIKQEKEALSAILIRTMGNLQKEGDVREDYIKRNQEVFLGLLPTVDIEKRPAVLNELVQKAFETVRLEDIRKEEERQRLAAAELARAIRLTPSTPLTEKTQGSTLVEQLVRIRKQYRDETKRSRFRLTKGESEKELRKAEQEILEQLKDKPREKAIADLITYRQVAEENNVEKRSTWQPLERFKSLRSHQKDKLDAARAIETLVKPNSAPITEEVLDTVLEEAIKQNAEATRYTPGKGSGRLDKIFRDLLPEGHELKAEKTKKSEGPKKN